VLLVGVIVSLLNHLGYYNISLTLFGACVHTRVVSRVCTVQSANDGK